MEKELPAAFIRLQKTYRVDPEEQGKLLQFIDEFEQLREEYFHTQGEGYAGTRKGGEILHQRLEMTMLKATYIPKNTLELLDLFGQLSILDQDILDAYWLSTMANACTCQDMAT